MAAGKKKRKAARNKVETHEYAHDEMGGVQERKTARRAARQKARQEQRLKKKKRAAKGKKQAVKGMGKAHMKGYAKKGQGKTKGKKGMAVSNQNEEVQQDLKGRSSDKNPVKYIRSLGHNVVTSLTEQTTTTLTVSTQAAGADSEDFLPVVAFLGWFDDNTGDVTCVDSLGHTYEAANTVSFNSGYKLVLFYAEGVSSLAKNAVITVTHPGSTRRIIMGDEFKNILKTDAADQTAAAYNTVAASFATSGMTGATSQNKELVYGVIAANGPSTDTFKKSTHWTLLHDRGTNASDGHDIRLVSQFRLAGDDGTFGVSGTFGVARIWGAITQTFKAEGGASDISKD